MFEKRAHFVLALLIILMPILAGGFYTKVLFFKLGHKEGLEFHKKVRGGAQSTGTYETKSSLIWSDLVRIKSYDELIKTGGLGDPFMHAQIAGPTIENIDAEAVMLSTGVKQGEPPKVDIVISFPQPDSAPIETRFSVPDLYYIWYTGDSPDFQARAAYHPDLDERGHQKYVLVEVAIPTGEFTGNRYVYRCTSSEETCTELSRELLEGGY